MIVFAYNFPHWKSQNGLINLVAAGFRPTVILQDRKELNIPHSDYRVVPKGEYLQPTHRICEMLGLTYTVGDHNTLDPGGLYDFGVILGARILSKELIERFPKGILNLHPGILPGNRGLDNLKHSIVRGLPIGVTAHLIDHRIDMGTIIKTRTVPVYPDDTIRDVYIRQRNYEQALMIEVLRKGDFTGVPCDYSEKFSVVDEHTDNEIEHLFTMYKQAKCGYLQSV